MRKHLIGPDAFRGPAQRVRTERVPDEPASFTVVRALARHRAIPITDVSTCLADYVDPEALDDLFAPLAEGGERRPGRIAFDVRDVEVIVSAEYVDVIER